MTCSPHGQGRRGVTTRQVRQIWKAELPLRLLTACLDHGPVKIAEFH